MKNFFGKNFSWWALILVLFAAVAFMSRPDLFGYEKMSSGSVRDSIKYDNGENEKGNDIDLENTVRVKNVIDGDTITLTTGENVRLLGIDTPERGEDLYIEAQQYLKELIWDKDIELRKDISHTDRYSRLLRHVYVDGIWINRKMISDGYARFVTFAPDVAHVDEFRNAQREARDAQRGLWAQ